MCLDTITKSSVILSNDTTVYKSVDTNGRYPEPMFVYDTGIVFNKPCVEADTDISLVSNDGEYYNSGFHCYMDTPEFLRLREKEQNIARTAGYKWFDFKEFIIPAGTEVTIGEEAGLRVIVSPILIDENVELTWYDWLWQYITELFRTLKQSLFG